MNFIPNSKPVIYPLLIVLIPLAYIGRLVLGKPFAQVKSKPVYFIFLNPVLHIPFHKLLYSRLAVVVIVTHIKWMGCSNVKIRTVCRRRTAWPTTLRIHTQLRVLSE